MKGILKRLTLVTLVFSMAMALMASSAIAEQEMGLYYSYIKEREETLGDFDNWAPAEKAAFAEWVEEFFPADDNFASGVPGEENMTMKEAVEMARQGIIAKYALKETVLLERFYEDVNFYTYCFWDPAFDADQPQWVIFFRVKNFKDYDDLGMYTVILYDQTGEMEITSAADSVG